MRWEKLGQILEIKQRNDWLISHAAVPFAIHRTGDIFRIYFSARNKLNQSQGAYIDYDIKRMVEVSCLDEAPLLSPGEPGLFDDAGVTLSCFSPNTELFYYMGWSLPKLVPFSNQIGAARINVSELEKISRHPILGKCDLEPYSFGYPWVIRVKDKYIMWYDTNLFWNVNSKKEYKFILRSAISDDGVNWNKTYHTNLELKEDERAIARPCVLYQDQLFKMWYSVDINGRYSMGYAESENGFDWVRMDSQVGIHPSKQGWDSEEIEYPFVFDHGSERFMLYNGNGYGKTGIGLARLTQD